MRILVIGINYVPERSGVAPFTTGLCEHWAAHGDKVTVVTAFPYYPEWRVWEGYRGSFHRQEVINDVQVHRVAHFIPRKPSSLIQRLIYEASFTMNCFLVALFTGGCDLIYCSCPTPTLGFAAFLLGKIKRAPHIIKITDLASDAALATGIMKPGLGIRLAREFERFVFQRAHAVICLCQGFIDKLKERGVDAEKLILIPDWGDTENIRPSEKDPEFLLAHGLPPERFLGFHTGNMGKKQGLINLVDAAELAKDDPRVLWILVGEGEERTKLEREILRRELNNIRLMPFQPANMLRQMYSSADILLLNQAATVEDAVIPSKLLTYMASGRPVVAAVNERSEAAAQIRRANCGVVVPADNPQALVKAVQSLEQDPAMREQLGGNGRAYAEAHFTKSRVLQRYVEFFRILCPPMEDVALASRRAGDD